MSRFPRVPLPLGRPATFRCALHRIDIEEGQCIDASSVPANNRGACCGTGCESPWRICRFCVLQGTIIRPSRVDQPVKETSIVVDRLNARCDFHQRFGTDAKRGETVVPPPAVKEYPPAEIPIMAAEAPSGTESSGHEIIVPKKEAVTPLLGLTTEAAKILEIPVARIRPYKGQPRKYFSERGLEGLSKTLQKVGQIQPIIVRPLKPEDNDPDYDWEIIEGERRWRSARRVGQKTVEAIVRLPESARKQYLISAVANFGRAGHTPFETMTVIRETMTLFGLTMQEAADVFGNSYGWVQQYLSLNNLHPKVWEAMAPEIPERKRLTFTVAKELARYSEEMQLELLQTILAKKMRVAQALFHIRQAARKTGMTQGPRKRSPRETFRILSTYLDLCAEKFERYVRISSNDIQGAIQTATPDEIQEISMKFRKCGDLLAALAERFQQTRKPSRGRV